MESESKTMSFIDGTWFREVNEMWAGYSVSLQIEEILHQEKSEYQEILIFKRKVEETVEIGDDLYAMFHCNIPSQFSKSFGNVLVLDGVIQCSERDEFAYQEMIAHLPLNCHSNPKNVLVVGGGDGGVVREVLKNPCVESVVLCEIDERVVELSKKFLPVMSQSFNDPRLTVHIGDGVKYMKNHKGQFDIIITDAPDPIGAAAGLFEKDYYQSMKAALKLNGIICCQGENLYLDLPLIQNMLTFCREMFVKVGYAYTMMPTYTGGHIGFVLTSMNTDVIFDDPVKKYTNDEIKKMNLKYYNTDIHRASFVLPQFAKEALG